MGFHSQRILGQAGFSGVTFAAKILRCELPRYWLPRAEFAANVIPCSAPLTTNFDERKTLTNRKGRQEDRDDGQPLRRLRGGSTLRIIPATTDQLRKGRWKVCYVFRIESTESREQFL